MKPRHQRLLLVVIALAMVGGAVAIVLRNLEAYVVYFYAPSDVIAHPPPPERYVRVGGLVKEGSIIHLDAMTIRFTVTDEVHDLVITYKGVVPGLFRAGQGVVAEGYIKDGAMTAGTILAKHDEYYMPPEVAKALKKSGHWKGEKRESGKGGNREKNLSLHSRFPIPDSKFPSRRSHTMTAELGTTLLYAAFILAVLQAGLVIKPAARAYAALLPALSVAGLLVMSAAFAVLITAFAISDFSLRVVAENSHTLKPMFYKITSAWGSHEGSILLWCWVLSFYSALLTLWRDDDLPLPVRAHGLHVMGGIQAIFLAYTIWTSSPFAALFPVPDEGAGFNPLLQDVGLAFHPPLLYLGYVGCAAPFALSVAALVTGHLRADGKGSASFAHALHPWILFPWTALTAGIGLGSWWAYRELGWGGWWFWDPVENASLLPWLVATALFHANLVMKKRGNFQRWVMALSLLTFMLSMLGTFLVRSGIITSVHSFASDPTRGYAVLAMLAAIAGYGLYAYLRYGGALKASQPVVLFSREMAILLNNFLLVLSMSAIVLAMLYPLMIEGFTGRLITIGEGYYNGVFRALMLPLLVICALSTATAWGGGSATRLKQSTFTAGGLAFLLSLGFVLWNHASLLCGMGIGLGLWILLISTYGLWTLRASRHIFRRLFPMHLAHGGLGLFTVAATLYGAMHTQSEFVMQVGQHVSAGDLSLRLNAMAHGNGANYVNRIGTLEARYGQRYVTLYPEERYYPVEEQFTTEAAIVSFLMHDDYATMKRTMQENTTPTSDDVAGIPPQGKIAGTKPVETVVITFHHNPGMLWLWVGVGCMASAGCAGLYVWSRHKRIG